MPAPMGHPNYATDNLGGRPREWTDERIEAEAVALEEWSKQAKNMWLKDFANQRGYAARYMAGFAKINERFRAVFEIARERQESKLFHGGALKNSPFNSSFLLVALKCNYKWIEGEERDALESDQVKTASQKALAGVKDTSIDHTHSIEQASGKPSKG